MSYGMDGWNHDNDLVRRRDVMDSLVKEYNRRFSLGERDGLKLAWIEKAVNDVPSAQFTQITRVNSNNALDAISRQAAIDALDEIESEVADGEGFQYEKWRVHFRVLPSAQPKSYREGYQAGFKDAQPEIVRCKDCKWFNDIGCAIYIVDDSDKPTENDYCSYGERREVSE